MATRSKATSQIQWSSSDTQSVAADAAFDYSDDFSFNGDTIYAQATIEADNSGTPASGDTIDIYMQHKQDPDNDTTDTYDNQGDYMCTLDTNDDDPAQRTIPIYGLIAGQTVRFAAVNNGASAITVGISIVEDKVTL